MNIRYDGIKAEYPTHVVLGNTIPADEEIFNIGGDGYAHPWDVRPCVHNAQAGQVVCTCGGMDDATGKRPSIRLVSRITTMDNLIDWAYSAGLQNMHYGEGKREIGRSSSLSLELRLGQTLEVTLPGGRIVLVSAT
jgi:hypothetical protein